MHHATTRRRNDGQAENEVARRVLDGAFRVHRTLGPGLLESVYERILVHELQSMGLRVSRQVAIALQYGELTVEAAFRADLMVEGVLLVELKSVEQVLPVHKKQVLTYLKLSRQRLGLLINFNTALLKDGVFRIAHGMPRQA